MAITIDAITQTTITTCIQIQKRGIAADPIDSRFTWARRRCL
jgi:hypothetical protein